MRRESLVVHIAQQGSLQESHEEATDQTAPQINVDFLSNKEANRTDSQSYVENQGYGTDKKEVKMLMPN